MKVTLTLVKKYTQDKDGKPLKTKDGRPYTRMNIQTKEYGDKFLSGFENPRNKNWQAGEEVEIEVKENGQYLNFDTPKKEQGGGMTEDQYNQLTVAYSKINTKLDTIIGLLSVPQEPEVPMPDFDN